MTKFDPAQHRLIAVDAEGNHHHVTAGDVVDAAQAERDPRAIAREGLARLAQDARSRIATPGKELVYLQQEAEARACFDDQDPLQTYAHPVSGEQISKYPHLQSMIGTRVQATADAKADMASAAILVLGKAADFRQASAQIERMLVETTARIESAQTVDELQEALVRAVWP